MRKLIAGILAGVALGTTTTAIAATTYRTVYQQHGVICKALGASAGYGVICILEDGNGYGIGFNSTSVIVQDGNSRTVFKRFQP